jgi:ferredoxin-fold anticodon binding domain-containing protein
MFIVYYFEGRNILLNQLRKNVPKDGEDIKIKGRKGKVSSVQQIDENKVHVQVTLESVNKNIVVLDNSKKKKR